MIKKNLSLFYWFLTYSPSTQHPAPLWFTEARSFIFNKQLAIRCPHFLELIVIGAGDCSLIVAIYIQYYI